MRSYAHQYSVMHERPRTAITARIRFHISIGHHDLRRTAATGKARLSVPPHVVERALNHVSGTFAGVAGVYNRFQYEDEVRAGLTMWDTHVQSLVKTESHCDPAVPT